MKKVNWGVIGCGGIADKKTIPGMMLAENAQCVAVMDLKPEVAQAIGRKYGISNVYTDILMLLRQEDIDAVYIATPVFCHMEHAMQSADAGKHILLEKPMGLSTQEASKIKNYCSANGVKLGIGFMMRFHDGNEKIKSIIANGEIGEVVTAYAKFNCLSPVSDMKWRQTKAFSGGGSMMDMGIHCVDLLQYVTKMQAVEIIAMTGNQIYKYPDTEDGATVVMRMENGALFTVEANFNIPEEFGCKFEIYGTKGHISADRCIGQTETGTITVSTLDNSLREVKYVSGNMYTKEIEKFSDAILTGGSVPVTAEEGLFNQRIIEAVYESQENGKRIQL